MTTSTTTTAPTLGTTRVERLKLGQAETAALKAWRDGGEKGTRPSTPNLDSIQKKERMTTSKSATQAVPAPELKAGQHLVALRNAKHGELIAGVLGKTRKSKVTDRYLVLTDTEAQKCFDEITAAMAGASEFHSRLFNLAALGIRAQVPTVTDARTTKVAVAVTALIASGVDWMIGAKSDATPKFIIGGVEHLTAAAALANPKVAKHAPATPAKPAAAKKAPAKKAAAKRTTKASAKSTTRTQARKAS